VLRSDGGEVALVKRDHRVRVQPFGERDAPRDATAFAMA
jgi:hypothetical protein